VGDFFGEAYAGVVTILDGASKTVDLTPFSFQRILSGRMIESPNEYEMGAGFGHKL